MHYRAYRRNDVKPKRKLCESFGRKISRPEKNRPEPVRNVRVFERTKRESVFFSAAVTVSTFARPYRLKRSLGTLQTFVCRAVRLRIGYSSSYLSVEILRD